LPGTELEQKSTYDILVATARNPSQAATFNHASMAHNNDFFFRSLAPSPVDMPDNLKAGIEESFGSVETLRREMLMTANAMFGPGFVWLVLKGRRLAVLPTYLAGSPYPQAHWRQQSTDMNTTGANGSAESWLVHTQARGLPNLEYLKSAAKAADQANLSYPPPQQPVAGTVHPQTYHSGILPPGSAHLTPVLCVNTWEHVWQPQYGFGSNGVGGKMEFLARWWQAVNWESVAHTALMAARTVSPELVNQDRVAKATARQYRTLGSPDIVVKGSDAEAARKSPGHWASGVEEKGGEKEGETEEKKWGLLNRRPAEAAGDARS
jgi:superoxide dismutase, Fe-Mn family